MAAIPTTTGPGRRNRWVWGWVYAVSFGLAPYLLAVHAWIGTVAAGPLIALWAVFQWQQVPWLRLIFGVMILPLSILVTLFAALIIQFGFHHPIAIFP